MYRMSCTGADRGLDSALILLSSIIYAYMYANGIGYAHGIFSVYLQLGLPI